MAINFWKLGGMLNSYAPLSQSGVVFTGLKIMDYTIRFKAKSASGGQMRVVDSSAGGLGTDIDQRPTLTSDFKQYEFSFSSKYEQSLTLIPLNSASDIEVKDIELVQKPLPKLTINGIDGFKSGKWTLHANAVAVDDETLVLNATAAAQSSTILLNITPNQPLTLSASSIDTDGYIQAFDNSATFKGQITKGSLSITFTPITNVLQLRINSGIAGTFTFKRPMLNIGAIPAPYSKKTGERMVMPVVKKNLFDGALESGTYSTNYGTKVASASEIRSVNLLPCKPNQAVSFSLAGSYAGNWLVYYFDVNKNYLSYVNTSNPTGLVTPSNAYFIAFRLQLTDLTTRVQLEQGTTPTAYEPYAVQVNKKPMRYVPKKNLFDKGTVTAGKAVSAADGTLTTNVNFSASDFIPIKPNTSYAKNISNGFAFYDINKSFISSNGGASSFTAPSNAYYVRISIPNESVATCQLEEGSTATPYEPYQLVLPKAKTGLVMDGVSNYVQLPSMTMDAIEIECLIDAVQSSSSYYLVDARNGLAGGYVYHGGVGSSFTEVKVDGITQQLPIVGGSFLQNNRVQRKKFFFKSSSPFTDDVNIFSGFGSSQLNERLKGTLYKVTCYLGGQIQAVYDFENPSNLVADKLIPNAKNLIPSFEDARWSLHSNFKVLGPNVGRLDATAGVQYSGVTLDVRPNTTYQTLCSGNSSDLRLRVRSNDVNGDILTTLFTGVVGTFTVPTGVSKIYFYLYNNSTTGSFDFIRPQLYALDGKEATLYGAPLKTRKQAKRLLYAKR